MPSIHWNTILPVTVTTLLLVTISCQIAVAFPLNLTQTDLASLEGSSPPPMGSITSMTGVPKSDGNNNQATHTRETFLLPPKQSDNLPTSQVVDGGRSHETMMIPPPPPPPTHHLLPSNQESVQYAPAARVRDRVYGRNYSELLAPVNSGIRDLDRTVEGSGQGPPAKPGGKSGRQKLDDTEDSDDDSDDDDYDDKEPLEIGSGQSHNILHTTSKPDLVPNRSDTIKKPIPSDFYKPFRPPVTTTIDSGNNHPNQFWPDKTVTSLAANPSPVGGQVVVSRATTLSSTIPPTTTAKPNLGGMTTHITVAPTARVVPPVARNKTETDYDYEDESEDDEPEEASVFEDNDGDGAVANRTTVSKFTTPSPIAVNRLNTTTKFDVVTTPKLNVTATTLPNRPNHQPPAPTPRLEPIRPMEQQPTQAPSKPVIKPESKVTGANQGNVDVSDDEEDEEEEEDGGDEEEEEEEEEEDGVGKAGGEDDEEAEEDKQDNRGPSLARRPEVPRRPTDSNQNSHLNQVVPLVTTTQPTNGRVHAAQPQPLPTTTTPASSQNSYSKPREYITTTPAPNVIVANPGRTNPVPIFPMIQQATAGVPSSSIPAIQPSRPPMQNFGATNSTPTPTRQPPISPPRSPPPINPMHFPPTPAPGLVPGGYSTPTTYPTGRVDSVNPPITKTTTTTTMSTASYHDDSLTRQIYDKAVEAYHEADKAIRSALEAVWPPNIHIDQSSLEPWLAQPIFFMLALGGAIIGLVLLMLLIVYMVTYQGQPKEDDDISIY